MEKNNMSIGNIQNMGYYFVGSMNSKEDMEYRTFLFNIANSPYSKSSTFYMNDKAMFKVVDFRAEGHLTILKNDNYIITDDQYNIIDVISGQDAILYGTIICILDTTNYFKLNKVIKCLKMGIVYDINNIVIYHKDWYIKHIAENWSADWKKTKTDVSLPNCIHKP